MNLRIETAYIVQVTQNRDGAVPLVAGRDGYLRVFIVADRENTEAPAVQVRLLHGGIVKETLTIQAESPGVPTAVDQSTLAKSWNVKIAGSLIAPGLQLIAEVDPSNGVKEGNENDNVFPEGGAPRTLEVHALGEARIRFVPMRQAENGRTGRISEANKELFLDFARKILPVTGFDADIRSPLTIRGGPFDPQGNTWVAAVSELNAVRVAEGTDRYYYGVIQTDYPGGGVVGMAAGIPSRASLGWDRPQDASETFAHELGHNWGRRHSPCGGAGGADPQYPYPLGFSGVFGMDVATGELKEPFDNTDIMGYCDAKFWISDYTFTGMYQYRRLNDRPASTVPQPTLLVWGRISNGELVLEPAFQITTRPELPAGGGPYRIAGEDAAGATLFSYSFAADRIPDVAGEYRVFAFAIPLNGERAERLTSLRLSGPGRAVAVRTAGERVGSMRELSPRFTRGVTARMGREEVTVGWDVEKHPMVMVREGATGEILSFARDGHTDIASASGNLELVFSDGVRSVSQRVAAPLR